MRDKAKKTALDLNEPDAVKTAKEMLAKTASRLRLDPRKTKGEPSRQVKPQ